MWVSCTDLQGEGQSGAGIRAVPGVCRRRFGHSRDLLHRLVYEGWGRLADLEKIEAVLCRHTTRVRNRARKSAALPVVYVASDRGCTGSHNCV